MKPKSLVAYCSIKSFKIYLPRKEKDWMHQHWLNWERENSHTALTNITSLNGLHFLISIFWSSESTIHIRMLFAVWAKIIASIFGKESISKYVQVKNSAHFHDFYVDFTYSFQRVLQILAGRWRRDHFLLESREPIPPSSESFRQRPNNKLENTLFNALRMG